jgi:PAS domain S-box-containing protein
MSESPNAIRAKGETELRSKDRPKEDLVGEEIGASSLIFLNRLRTSIDASAIVAVTDLAGKIKTVNERFCEISGYSREELLGQDHRILNSGYHPKEFFQEMWQTIQAGENWHGIICNRRKNGENYWVNSTIIPFKDSAGRIEEYFSIRFDFTQQKKLEDKMICSAKMSSLGEMAGNIVHEINNPLAIIQGKSRQILRSLENPTLDPTVIQRHAAAIEATSDRIVKIMQGIRAFSHDGLQSPMETEKVAIILKDMLSMSSARFASKGVELRCGEVPEDLLLFCRPVQICQVLLNLLNNSFDAIKETLPCWVAVDVVASGELIELSVTDSGNGISEDLGKKIFQPFFTTKATGQGTGLGLGIATSIVEAHGGTLKIDHRCANTRFVLLLPKAQKSTAFKSA